MRLTGHSMRVFLLPELNSKTSSDRTAIAKGGGRARPKLIKSSDQTINSIYKKQNINKMNNKKQNKNKMNTKTNKQNNGAAICRLRLSFREIWNRQRTPQIAVGVNVSGKGQPRAGTCPPPARQLPLSRDTLPNLPALEPRAIQLPCRAMCKSHL